MGNCKRIKKMTTKARARHFRKAKKRVQNKFMQDLKMHLDIVEFLNRMSG